MAFSRIDLRRKNYYFAHEFLVGSPGNQPIKNPCTPYGMHGLTFYLLFGDVDHMEGFLSLLDQELSVPEQVLGHHHLGIGDFIVVQG